jgi:hippurate hydrolase
MSTDLLAALRAYEPELIDIRRDIHAHPETGFEEVRTSALVAEKLRGWGIDVHQGLAKTGVVGTLRGRLPGQRAVALRADMDALNIEEKTGRPYASTVPGKMHACGHDGHTTMLLGAARYLAEHPDEFGGTVHFVFQPAEEGGGGGRVMIEEGLFRQFPADAVYGLHNKPGRPAGTFHTRVGPMLAAADRFEVTFRGSGGHGGSSPHLSTDPTMPTGYFITGLQSIVGRNVAAADTAVISVGYVGGGSLASTNVIPSEVVVGGTARSYRPEIRALLEQRTRELAQNFALAYGCTAEVVWKRGYPPLVNHAEQVELIVQAAGDLVGADAVDGNMVPITGAEDFSYMLEAKPGAFMMLGNDRPGQTEIHHLHTPRYDFNDDMLTVGAAYWISVVRRELGPARDD